MPQRPANVKSRGTLVERSGGPYPAGKVPSRVSASRQGAIAMKGRGDDGTARASRSPPLIPELDFAAVQNGAAVQFETGISSAKSGDATRTSPHPQANRSLNSLFICLHSPGPRDGPVRNEIG